MSFISPSRFRFVAIAAVLISMASFVKAADGYYYQLKVYHFKSDAQLSRTEAYLQKAYLPALHRAGVKSVGVFFSVVFVSLGLWFFVFFSFFFFVVFFLVV